MPPPPRDRERDSRSSIPTPACPPPFVPSVARLQPFLNSRVEPDGGELLHDRLETRYCVGARDCPVVASKRWSRFRSISSDTVDPTLRFVSLPVSIATRFGPIRV